MAGSERVYVIRWRGDESLKDRPAIFSMFLPQITALCLLQWLSPVKSDLCCTEMEFFAKKAAQIRREVMKCFLRVADMGCTQSDKKMRASFASVGFSDFVKLEENPSWQVKRVTFPYLENNVSFRCIVFIHYCSFMDKKATVYVTFTGWWNARWTVDCLIKRDSLFLACPARACAVEAWLHPAPYFGLKHLQISASRLGVLPRNINTMLVLS